ncbi:mannitol dehydrogenase family protein [Subtercola boreus]|uniref:mannitol dehydrogenase family protein n=1 Tax=Subtercola boreus TaxID=120213 RepID=UPI00209BE006|nr:mannitol dehydrogenase family protein [Subtercola boreus]
MTGEALTRDALARRTGLPTPTPPVRIVHLGLGAFHRAHQAWYTARASDGAEWGIAAFTGRSPQAALELSPQDGLYTLIERAESGDSATVITSIVEANDGADVARLAELLRKPAVAIVTLTITEAGYRLDSAGRPDPADPSVAADVALLRDRLTAPSTTTPPASALQAAPSLQTTLGRLLFGLNERRTAEAASGIAAPIAVVPCDNLPGNGPIVEAALLALAEDIDPSLAAWIAGSVSFVSTSVDRITPKTTPADLESATRLTGWHDAAPVMTEPFSDWVLSGDFPAGRPDWESAGARFVDEIAPFENRKLWLLNGAHSLLAYTARQRGHETVASAIADPGCLDAVNAFWAEAVIHLPGDVDLQLDAYRRALLERFGNTRIEHRLAQIANDAVGKLRIRIVPVVLAEWAAGRSGDASLSVIRGWISQVLPGGVLHDGVMTDAVEAQVRAAAALPEGASEALLGLIDPRLIPLEGENP